MRARNKEPNRPVPFVAITRGALLAAFLIAAGTCLGASVSSRGGGATRQAVTGPRVAGSTGAEAGASHSGGTSGLQTGGEHGGGTVESENASDVSPEPVRPEPVWVVVARLLNFAVLVGVLVYFLRAPIARYLARRSSEIRGELAEAAQAREEAVAELASIERKMQALPGEIEALKARGAEEIAAEEARIRRSADAERERLLEQARREIELQLRAAERDLVRRASELIVGLASDRIKRAITEEDQKRLVDQYLAQIQK